MKAIEMSDAESVARISRDARRDAIPNLPDLYTRAQDLKFFQSQIATKSGYVWVNEHGSVVAFVMWMDGFIDHLYVDPDQQRAGIGTLLLNEAMAAMAVSDVKLWTFQSNVRAVSFYIKNGFSILDETDGHRNDERLPDYLFVRAAAH